ncbi:error-prone DNA polymerase [Prosthecomicrobium pneumaticum]|uniref:Error-prone DNA polymerase n=1 Tax=Prosthecomicrobium pneumaticum TaxID=81895 RepID=A0A7W9CTV3_9HYPH|nr:error-prone DNA polymerase [Prosthecomicrobium pneumaticum]MBB5751785.1 error-prone DNA polymerase [Prosthecomicrobium pneumaticum]
MVLASAPAFAELVAASNYSFLRGASRPGEMVLQAAFLQLHAIGIADRNTLAGVVQAMIAYGHRNFPAWKPKLLVGSRLVFSDGTPDIVAYPQDRDAYGRLTRLLTLGNMKTGQKAACHLEFADLLAWCEGLSLIVVPPARPEAAERVLDRLAAAAPGQVWLAAAMGYAGADRRRLARLGRLAERAGVPLIATNDALYHAPERRPLQDVVSCIREKVTLDTAGRRLEANAERHLKPAAEMARLFRDRPDAVAETVRFADRIRFRMEDIRYDYPDEPVPPGRTAQGHLEALTWEGAQQRYPDGVPAAVATTIETELATIARLDYAAYFLTVYDIVRFARERGILCQGRGSAANSSVCFVLGITSVDPKEGNLLFSRFISEERNEPPDIDVDFEHERREEVIQYVFGRYGRDRAAIAATVICYRPRSAIREVGKVLGLTEDVTAALAGTIWGSWGDEIPDEHIRKAGLDPDNPSIRRATTLAEQLLGFPRHLSQHVGGFVLTRGRLDECVPIGPAAMENRTFIEWDKDDLDELKMMKVDVLALGMLTCIRKAFDLIERHGGRRWELATIPWEEKAVYDMLCRGDSLGVFQVESRAQMNMLPRLKPRRFYDLVIEVAIVRPGPIQGDMVHPYLKRRSGQEKVEYPRPDPPHDPDELKRVLEKTLGVPLFQEQAMRIAIEAAGFSEVEANRLRRSMATFRNLGTIGEFRDKLIGGMTARGYPRDFAERCFKQIEGFGSYGFPESHAASFARLVYVSAWIKCFHPAVFACALLNSQPMGFYAPAEIVRDAREHGVAVQPADIGRSGWDNTLEGEAEALALRLGFRQIDGFREDWARAIETARAALATGEEMAAEDGARTPAACPFRSIEHFARATRLPKAALVKLAEADAFGALGLERRAAIWAVRRLPNDRPLPLFAFADAAELGAEAGAALPSMPASEEVVADYRTTRLSLKGHPMQFLRARFAAEGAVSCAAVRAARDGMRMKAAGVVLVRQRPGSAKGVVFMTFADETGVANAVIWPKVMQRFRREVMASRLILIEGRIQRSAEGVVHLVAERLVDRTADLGLLSEDLALDPPLARADEVARPQPDRRPSARHPRDVRILPNSRDFH